MTKGPPTMVLASKKYYVNDHGHFILPFGAAVFYHTMVPRIRHLVKYFAIRCWVFDHGNSTFLWWYHVPTERGWYDTTALQYYHYRRPQTFIIDINKGLRRLAALSSPPHLPQPHIKTHCQLIEKNNTHQTRLQCIVWGSLIFPNRHIPSQLSYKIMLCCWNPTTTSLNMNK